MTPGTSVGGRVVLVLDDILDEGKTLAAVREKLLEAGAREVYCAVFADKDIGRAKPVSADFVGVRAAQPLRVRLRHGRERRLAQSAGDLRAERR